MYRASILKFFKKSEGKHFIGKGYMLTTLLFPFTLFLTPLKLAPLYILLKIFHFTFNKNINQKSYHKGWLLSFSLSNVTYMLISYINIIKTEGNICVIFNI